MTAHSIPIIGQHPRMKCTFCHKQLTDDQNIGFFKCPHHNVTVTFLCRGNIDNYGIQYTSFEMRTDKELWIISLSHLNNICCLHRYPYGVEGAGPENLILRFNHLPEITPKNARDKLKTWLTFL